MIVVDRAVDESVIKVFADAAGREPNDDELYALRRVWLDNEVLYREGIALQLDKGDSTIRDRIIFKMLSSIEPTLKLSAIRRHHAARVVEAHRDKNGYSPARYDFKEAVLHGPEFRKRGARIRVGAERRRARRRASGLARVRSTAAAESRAELWRRFRETARRGAGRHVDRHQDERKLARDAARQDRAGTTGRLRRAARSGASGLDRRDVVGAALGRGTRDGAALHRAIRGAEIT